MMEWTDERVDELKRLFEEGLSSPELAAKMGLTRSAIMGKCRRLGLKIVRKIVVRTSQTPVCPKQRNPKSRTKVTRYATRWGAYSTETKPGELPPETIVDLAPLNIPLADIRALQCRWISNEAPVLFCGHSAPVGSWCPAHRAVVFMPPHHRQGIERPDFMLMRRKQNISASTVLAWDFERGTAA
jgi:GcrA cell cycle regulator